MTTQQDKELSSAESLTKIADWLGSQVNMGQNAPDEPPDFCSQFDYELAHCVDDLRAIARDLTSPQLPVAEQPAGQAQGALKIMGDITTKEPDGSEQNYPMALLIAFDNVASIRQAIADGKVAFDSCESQSAAPHSPVAPNCGACPGDGSFCKSACRHDADNPPVAQMSGFSGDDIAKAWYATGQDIRGGSLHSFMDSLIAAHPSNAAVPAEFDVRTMLKDVVPGDDGMGQEVYFKNVDEVVQAITDMSEKLEAATVPQVVQAPIMGVLESFVNEVAIGAYTAEELPARALQALKRAPQPVAASPSIVPTWEQRMEPTVSPSWTQIIRAMKAENVELRALLTTASNAGEAAQGDK